MRIVNWSDCFCTNHLGLASLIVSSFLYVVTTYEQRQEFPKVDGRIDSNEYEDLNRSVVEVRVGFLVGRQRILNGSIRSDPRHSSRLGRILTLVFEHALNKINENLEKRAQANRNDGNENWKTNETETFVQLRPLIVETYSNERESVRQTINLILNQRVHVIVGPDRESCALESMLATVFNVPMVSYHCTQLWPSETDNRDDDSDENCAIGPGAHEPASLLGSEQSRPPSGLINAVRSTTLVQTKPPSWKIVNRVIELVRKMLDLDNNYPQQLVLLYFEDGFQQQQRQAASSADSKRTSSATMNKTASRDARDQHRAPRVTNRRSGSAATTTSTPQPTLASDPDGQYKIIGRLLEIKLAQLLSDRRGRQRTLTKTTTTTIKGIDQSSLSVLNWHTTYHYGYMMNPFRRLIRNHLFHPRESPRARYGTPDETSRATQCDAPPTSRSTNGSRDNNNNNTSQRPPSSTASIYIIVGHYYEHLGLMLALNELGLLAFDKWQTKPRTSTTASGPARDTEHPEFVAGDQSSRTTSIEDEYLQQAHYRSTKGTKPRDEKKRPTIVIGVDIEPPDERDDSVPFLRGLLMDANDNSNSNNIRQSNLISPKNSAAGTSESAETNQAFGGNDLSSLTLMYNHYIGVIPTRPSKSSELLGEMRHFYNRTTSQQQQRQQNQAARSPPPPTLMPNANGDQMLASDAPDGHNYHQLSGGHSIASKINQTGARAGHLNDLTLKMLQFARLPIEAYYLYDSIALLGEYFATCVNSDSNLNSCSQGDRLLNWFTHRNYSSHLVDDSDEDFRESSFDSRARAEGLYSLIARRVVPVEAGDETKQHDGGASWPFAAEEELDIAPVGRFAPGCSAPIQFTSAWSNIAEIWWPLWCETLGKDPPDPSELNCSHLLKQSKAGNQSSSEGDGSPIGRFKFERILSLRPLILFCLFICLIVAVSIISSHSKWKLTTRLGGSNVLYLNCLSGDDVSSNWQQNLNWFTESDAENFLHIVSNLLLPSSIDESDDDGGSGGDGDGGGSLEADGGGQPPDHLKEHEKLCEATAHLRPKDTTSGLSFSRSRPLKRQRQADDEVGQRDSVGHRRKRLEQHQQRRQQQQQHRQTPVTATTTQAIDLHCYMFPFPSCKFVHWLIGLHTLKEMLFKYQSNAGANSVAVAPKATAASKAFFKRWRGGGGGGGEAGTSGGGPYSLSSGWNRLMFQLPILSQGRSTRPEFKWNDAHGNGNDNRRCCLTASTSKCSYRQAPSHMRDINLEEDDDVLVEGARDKEFGQAPPNSAREANCKFSHLSGTFFSARHEGLPTLRLLLTKYKTINEHLCHLSKLNHSAIVRVFGVTLTNAIGHNRSSKRARMIIEATDRANLRQELSMLNSELHINSAGCMRFKPILWSIWLRDLMEGLEYLHDHPEIQFHGRLCATTCLITHNWRLKLSGFHVDYMRRSLGNYEIKQQRTTYTDDIRDATGANRHNQQAATIDVDADVEADAYAAPELLERQHAKYQPGQMLTDAQAMKLADIYSFGYVLYEILDGQQPWAFLFRDSEDCRTYSAVSPSSVAVTSSGANSAATTSNRRRQQKQRTLVLVAERVKVDPGFRPPIARLDKIWPIISHNLQCAGAVYSKDTFESAHESSLHNDRQSFLLAGPPRSTANMATSFSLCEAAWSRLIDNHDGEAEVQQKTVASIGSALEATKRLVESCWAKSSPDRPQSVDHIRQLLNRGLLRVLSHLSYLEAKRRQLQSLWLCQSWPGRPLAHAHHGALKQNTNALEVYAKLIEEASRERFRALAHQNKISTNLRLALLPETIDNLVANLHAKGNSNLVISTSFDNIHLCTFRLLMVAGTSNLTKSIDLDQLEVLTEFLGKFDKLVGSFRGHLNLWDSQVDSLLRFTIYAGDIWAPVARLDPSLKESNDQSQCSSLTNYKHIRLLTTFAFELIDLVNRCQCKPGVCLQVKSALHTGSIVGGLLLAQGDNSATRSGYMKLARFVPFGQTMQILETLEQTCQPQRIQISSEMRATLLELPEEKDGVTIADDQHVSRLKLIPDLLRGGTSLDEDPLLQQQQGYIMMRRTNKVRMRNADLETYWLLNGPRVTSSQRLMLPLIDS